MENKSFREKFLEAEKEKYIDESTNKVKMYTNFSDLWKDDAELGKYFRLYEALYDGVYEANGKQIGVMHNSELFEQFYNVCLGMAKGYEIVMHEQYPDVYEPKFIFIGSDKEFNRELSKEMDAYLNFRKEQLAVFEEEAAKLQTEELKDEEIEPLDDSFFNKGDKVER